MKIRLPNCQLFFFLLLGLTGCIEPYPPPVSEKSNKFLVVDGFFDSSNGSAKVKLNRTVPLASTAAMPTESKAIVTLEDNFNKSYLLPESEKGIYTITGLTANPSYQYRLHIKTADGNEYLSAFIQGKDTPPIDAVSWEISEKNDGIDIIVSTHDDTKKSRYYLWTFDETFEYTSAFYATHLLKLGKTTPIPSEEQIYRCWKTIASQKIYVGSSENLSADVIDQHPVNFIPNGSQKLQINYSILVKQRTISKETYQFWLNLQKTTESLGSLFDPQPGQVTGNIKSIRNTNEIVLGNFDVGMVKEKRILISYNQLPKSVKEGYAPAYNCTRDTIKVGDLAKYNPGPTPILLVGFNESPAFYFVSTPICSDCRLQQGVTTKPPFW